MKSMFAWRQDKRRVKRPPLFLYWYRTYHAWPKSFRPLCRVMLAIYNFMYKVDFPYSATIGPGLYIGHPYAITINPKATIGANCNIHKGVTIGQENRGQRKGVPTIGDNVWIGINATIIGNINIGNDVLIAPGAFVNRDIPSHSIVLGNPCIIKYNRNATKDYITYL